MLDDKYRIDELLEVGGMGAVYAGSHTQLQKRVAIKVLRREFFGASEVVERFQREAIAASRIGHENIVQVTDLGRAFNGAPFLVMEYLEGEDLAGRIERGGPLAVGHACLIAQEILSAIQAAHAAGILHRDLKPQNIFLVRQSRGESVKILDFGISRMVAAEEPDHRLTHTGLVLGTPYYMAPEQAAAEADTTAAVDIYSIGVILYEMLTGKVPFEATNYNTVIYKVLSGEFPPPRALAPHLPAALEQVVCRAMALHPASRLGSAAEFSAALAPFAPVRSSSQPIPVEWNASGQPVPAPTPAAEAAMPFGPTLADSAAVTRSPESGSEPRAPSRAWVWVLLSFALLAGIATAGVIAMSRGKEVGGEESAAAAGDPDELHSAAAAEEPEPAKTPAPAPEAGSPESAEPPEPIKVTFVVTPPDAEIRVAGELVEGNEIERPPSGEEVEVAVSREGYRSKTRTISLDVHKQVEFLLERERGGETKERSRRRNSRRGEKSGGSTPRDRPRPEESERIISDSPYE